MFYSKAFSREILSCGPDSQVDISRTTSILKCLSRALIVMFLSLQTSSYRNPLPRVSHEPCARWKLTVKYIHTNCYSCFRTRCLCHVSVSRLEFRFPSNVFSTFNSKEHITGTVDLNELNWLKKNEILSKDHVRFVIART